MIKKMLDLCVPFANDSVMILLQTGYVLCYMPNIIYNAGIEEKSVPLKLVIYSIPVIPALIFSDFFFLTTCI